MYNYYIGEKFFKNDRSVFIITDLYYSLNGTWDDSRMSFTITTEEGNLHFQGSVLNAEKLVKISFSPFNDPKTKITKLATEVDQWRSSNQLIFLNGG